MTPAVIVALAWLAFGGSHLLLSSSPLRGWIVRRYDEKRFVLAYTGVAIVSMSLLIAAVTVYGSKGQLGLAMNSEPIARWLLMGVAAFGAALAVAGIAGYTRSPMSRLAGQRRAGHHTPESAVLPPAGVARITRHPFFVGIALLMGAHVLLATSWATATYFGGFVLLALLGIPMQDRKLRAQHGEAYGRYLDQTTALPFTGNRPDPPAGAGVDWSALGVAAVGTAVLYALHPLWRMGNGASFAALTLLGGAAAVLIRIRRA